MQSGNTTLVGIIGFGYIGSVVSASLQDCSVLAFDVNPDTASNYIGDADPTKEAGVHRIIRDKINKGLFKFTNDLMRLSEPDVLMITVGTPINSEGQYDLSAIEAVIEDLLYHSRPEQLIILKSTLTPGTTAKCIAPLMEKHKNLRFCYCPERLAEGTAMTDLKQNPMLVSGFDQTSIEHGVNFIKRHLGLSCRILKSVEEAEMLKLATNAWMDLNIAFANEIAQLCAEHDIDTMSLIDNANTLKKGDSYVNILRPSVGVGGSCLTKDPIALWNAAKSKYVDLKLTKLARTINEEMPSRHVAVLDNELKTLGLIPQETKIATLGISFKSNVADTRGSPAVEFVSKFRELGYTVECFDPYVSGTPFEEGLNLNTCVDSTLKNASVVAFLCGHNEFNSITPELIKSLAKNKCIIYDGRAYFGPKEIETFRKVGLEFIGPSHNSLIGKNR